MNASGFDDLVGLLGLPSGARVLDIACGKAEPLIRIACRYPINGVGVDLCPDFVAAARAATAERLPASSSVEIIEQGGAQYTAPDGSFDLAICLGASWVFGGHRGTVRRLASLVRPGGQVLVAEPHLMREPEPANSEAGGERREAFGTHAQNAAVGAEEGLALLYTVVSTQADWDRYEGRRWSAGCLPAVGPGLPGLVDLPLPQT